MTQQSHEVDPFATTEKTPSVSFKDAPIGTTYTCIVTDVPKVQQSRDYETNEPAFWDDGKPKNAVVIGVTVNGEAKAIWAPYYPKALFEAIAKAQKDAGAKIAVGGELLIRYIGDGEQANPRKAAPKLYAAKYVPPTPVDPFVDQPAAPAAAAPWDATPQAAPVGAAPWATDAPPF